MTRNLWASNCNPIGEHGHCLYCCPCNDCKGDKKKIYAKFVEWLTKSGYKIWEINNLSDTEYEDLIKEYRKSLKPDINQMVA